MSECVFWWVDRWAGEMAHHLHLMVGKMGWERSGERSEVTQSVSGWGLPQVTGLQSKALSCWRLLTIHMDSGEAKAGVCSQQSWTVEVGHDRVLTWETETRGQVLKVTHE